MCPVLGSDRQLWSVTESKAVSRADTVTIVNLYVESPSVVKPDLELP